MAKRARSLQRLAWILCAGAAALISGCGGLAPEYLVVELQPGAVLEHAGSCELADIGERLDADEVSVLIEGECQGMVGEVIPLTAGSLEISADVVGAEVVVVELELTTYEKPRVVVLEIAD